MLQKDTRISVALAVYNGEKFLEQQLQSLKEQSLQPFEIVILNDCSTDNSESIIKQFIFPGTEILYHKNEKNHGHLLAFKKLASLCNGDFIAFCDQDDVWHKDKLEISVKYLLSFTNDKPAIVFSDLRLVNDKNELLESSFWKYNKINPSKTKFFDVLGDNIITGCTSFINRAMLDEVKKMPDDALLHDHWMALIAYGFGTYFPLHQTTINYRIHGQSVTDKNKFSLLRKVMHVKKTKEYFNKKINQAKQFAAMYVDILSQEKRKELNDFIALEKGSFIKARFLKKFKI